LQAWIAVFGASQLIISQLPDISALKVRVASCSCRAEAVLRALTYLTSLTLQSASQ